MPSYQSSYTGAQVDAILAEAANASNTYVAQNTLFNLIYPVGSIYMSVNSTSPQTLFGGTWTQIQDTFLLAAGSTYSAGGTGGSATHSHSYEHTHTTPATTTGSHTLVQSEIPGHAHSMTLTVYNFASSVSFARNDNNGDSLLAQDDKGSGTTAPFCSRNYGNTGSTGGGGGHTHPQVATTTDSQSTSTTGDSSSLPPYFTVYMWQRTA